MSSFLPPSVESKIEYLKDRRQDTGESGSMHSEFFSGQKVSIWSEKVGLCLKLKQSFSKLKQVTRMSYFLLITYISRLYSQIWLPNSTQPFHCALCTWWTLDNSVRAHLASVSHILVSFSLIFTGKCVFATPRLVRREITKRSGAWWRRWDDITTIHRQWQCGNWLNKIYFSLSWIMNLEIDPWLKCYFGFWCNLILHFMILTQAEVLLLQISSLND